MNWHSIGNASLNASRKIRLGAAVGIKDIVMFGALHGYSTKPTANFKSFDSNEEISFIHIEISFTDTAVRKGGLSIFSNWHEIEMNNGMKERFTFTVQNGGEWMLLMKVIRSELSKR